MLRWPNSDAGYAENNYVDQDAVNSNPSLPLGLCQAAEHESFRIAPKDEESYYNRHQELADYGERSKGANHSDQNDLLNRSNAASAMNDDGDVEDAAAPEVEEEAPRPPPACVSCRKSKVKCEGGIPCRRCTRLGTENTCKRCERRKRGRKRKAVGASRSRSNESSSRHRKKSPMPKSPITETKRPKRISIAADAADSARGADEKMTVSVETFENLHSKSETEYEKLMMQATSFLPPASLSSALTSKVVQLHCMNGRFFNWRTALLSSAARPAQAAIDRFMCFSQHLVSELTVIERDAQLATEHASSDKDDLTVQLLCEQIKQAASDLKSRAIAYMVSESTRSGLKQPKDIHSDPDYRQYAVVERDVCAGMPIGAMSLAAQPALFSKDSQQYVWVNQSLVQLLGYSPSESHIVRALLSSSSTFYRILHADDFPAFFAAIWDTVAAGESETELRLRFIRRDGTLVDALCTLSVKYHKGTVARVLLFLSAQGAGAQVSPHSSSPYAGDASQASRDSAPLLSPRAMGSFTSSNTGIPTPRMSNLPSQSISQNSTQEPSLAQAMSNIAAARPSYSGDLSQIEPVESGLSSQDPPGTNSSNALRCLISSPSAALGSIVDVTLERTDQTGS